MITRIWPPLEPKEIRSRDEAMGILVHAALSQLWAASDFQPYGEGCCHVCCGQCAALLFLDRRGVLDEILAQCPVELEESDIFPGGKLDRAWMYRQWAGSEIQKGCGHRLQSPVEPHLLANCGPLDVPLAWGDTCPTCGTELIPTETEKALWANPELMASIDRALNDPSSMVRRERPS